MGAEGVWGAEGAGEKRILFYLYTLWLTPRKT